MSKMTDFEHLHYKCVEKLATWIVYQIIKIWYYNHRPKEKRYNILYL